MHARVYGTRLSALIEAVAVHCHGVLGMGAAFTVDIGRAAVMARSGLCM